MYRTEHRITLLIMALLSLSPGARADCAMNDLGVVLCAEVPTGGALMDRTGTVVCGRGDCAKNRLGFVVCAKTDGGGIARDRSGELRCLGGCESADTRYCVKAMP